MYFFAYFAYIEIIHMDKLDKIFQLQEALNIRTGCNFYDISGEEQIHWLLELTRALQQETAELVDTVPWKWWKKHQLCDLEHAKEELIDILHFVICLAQALGMDADALFKKYTEKNHTNHQRQDNGY